MDSAGTAPSIDYSVTAPSCTKVTGRLVPPTVFPMGKPEWPWEDFNNYLEGLMVNAGIADREELSRLTGVTSGILSKWKRGIQQPSRTNLNRLAPVLKVRPALLQIAAGVSSVEELDLPEQPDLRVLPNEVQALIDVLANPRLPQDERDQLLAGVGLLVGGVQARLDQAARPNRTPRVNRLA